MTRQQILGLCGSLRRDSYNRRLLAAAAKERPDGVVVQMFDGLGGIPPFNEDSEADPPPASVRALRDAITSANGLLIATPEYNASLPGHLKNALDWASRPYMNNPLRGKPAAVLGASPNAYGAVLAQAELRKVLKAIGAHVIEQELPLPRAHDAFTADGRLADVRLRVQVATLLERLVGAASAAAIQQFA